MTMNRRQFLKNMGIGAAGAALPGVSMFAANEAMNPQDKSLFKLPELHCDVIVVGAGPAGIPAAVAAAREGAKVILLEEDMMPGGAPGRYVCHIYVRCTPCRCIYRYGARTEPETFTKHYPQQHVRTMGMG